MKVAPMKIKQNHPFATLIEKDTPIMVIENGFYSDWQYNRINVMQLNAFCMECLIGVLSLFEFEIRKKKKEVLMTYQTLILYIILLVTVIKIFSLFAKN